MGLSGSAELWCSVYDTCGGSRKGKRGLKWSDILGREGGGVIE